MGAKGATVLSEE